MSEKERQTDRQTDRQRQNLFLCLSVVSMDIKSSEAQSLHADLRGFTRIFITSSFKAELNKTFRARSSVCI